MNYDLNEKKFIRKFSTFFSFWRGEGVIKIWGMWNMIVKYLALDRQFSQYYRGDHESFVFNQSNCRLYRNRSNESSICCLLTALVKFIKKSPRLIMPFTNCICNSTYSNLYINHVTQSRHLCSQIMFID